MKSRSVTIKIKATEEYFPVYCTIYYAAVQSGAKYNDL